MIYSIAIDAIIQQRKGKRYIHFPEMTKFKRERESDNSTEKEKEIYSLSRNDI